MAIQATGRATFTAVEDYDIVFVLNGVRCDTLNFDSVRSAESAVLEADFTNGGAPCVVDRAVLACYDGEGTLMGSSIEVHDSSSAVADGGNLYLSKDCRSISCEIYQGEKRLCARSITVVRNGSGVSVKAVAYKVLNNVAAGAALNWDSVQSQANYPTQKPDKGKYCYVMTIVLYTDGTSTNTVSTSYTPTDGNNGTSITIKETKVEYAGGDNGTTAPTTGWGTNVPQLAQGQYLWTRTTITYSDGTPVVSYSVGRIGMDGAKGGTTHILYASSANPQSDRDVRTTIDAGHQYYGTYQDTELNDDVKKYWRVTGWVLIKGDQGHTPTITIGTNGNWYIDGADSGQKAQGNAGHTPSVTIGSDGYWYIDGTKTSQKAQGDKGDTGASLVTLITDYSYNQSDINAYSNNGYSRTWAVQSTEGAKVGDTVLLRVTNTSKGGYCFIIAKITAIPSSTSVTCTSNGLIDKGDQGIQGPQGPQGNSFDAKFLLNGISIDVLNFDTIKSLEGSDVSLEVDFLNNGVAYNVNRATLTCYDAEGSVLGSPIDVTDASSIIADGGNLYLSKNCKLITAVAYDAAGNVLKEKSVTVMRDTQMYALKQLNTTRATVKASDSTTSATFALDAELHFQVVKNTGGNTENPTITSIKATAGSETFSNSAVNNIEATLTCKGTVAYNATNRPPSTIQVEVVCEGKTLYATVPVTMEAGVAIDINNNIGNMSVTVKGQGDDISTLQSDGKSISAKVSGMDSGLKATGVDIENHKITATTDNFEVCNNSGTLTFSIDKDGNIVGAGNAYFKGTITGSVISGSTIKSEDGTYKTTIQGGSITTNNIAASGGSIGEWTIKDGGLTAAYGSKACIDMRDSKSSFRLDSDKTTNGGSLLSIYNYSGRVMSIVSEDSDESALYIRSNGNARNLAISTFGNNSFLSRVREGTVINRLAYACVRTGDVNVDFEDLFVTKETGKYKYPGNVVITTNYNYEQTVKFPANPVLGVQLIVIQGTNKKVHFDGNGHSFQQGTDVSSSANSNQNGQWNLFIFDGQYWQCIYITGHLLW